MMTLCSEVLKTLEGKTLVTAESCTGGSIGAALTAIAGSSTVYKGGIVSYCNGLKEELLGVDKQLLDKYGAVSGAVAEAMAAGARKNLNADVAVSVTGLAGPGGDDFGNAVGTVFIGYCDENILIHYEYHFYGDRELIRMQAVKAALQIVLRFNQ